MEDHRSMVSGEILIERCQESHTSQHLSPCFFLKVQKNHPLIRLTENVKIVTVIR